MRISLATIGLLLLTCTVNAQTYDLVLAGGRVMDPETGLDAIRNVGISGGTIRELSEAPLHGREVLDATGLVVAPGFIDLNTYQNSDPLFRLRVADGVTSVLQLEGGAIDVAAYYDALEGHALINYGAAVDHGAARRIAQGDTTQEVFNGLTDWPGINENRLFPELDRRGLSDAEKDKLVTLIERGLKDGAVAVGLGIEYVPGATHSEVLQMFELAAQYGASAHLHVRNYDDTREWGEMYEVLAGAIFAGGDLHINHLHSIYGKLTEKALTFVERARSFGLQVTTECYPYTAGMTFIDSALFDDWETRSDEDLRRFEWPATGERLTRESFGRYRAQGGVVVIHARDETRQEAAVRACLEHPLPMIASDGAWDGGVTHPRSAGTNSRVLGKYVREEGVLSLMDAIRKMSLAPAVHLQRRVRSMRNKGRVQIGADADLVLFDPATIDDRSTYREPLLPPVGIRFVFVAGVPVVLEGVIQDGVFPGRAIRGPIVVGAKSTSDLAETSAASTTRHAIEQATEQATDQATDNVSVQADELPNRRSSNKYDLVIAGGRVMDPETGLDGVRNVGVTNGVIRAVSESPLQGREVIDATGKVVAPGFIDLNTGDPTPEVSAVRVMDGVTSAFVMESATSEVAEWYEAQRGKSVTNYGTAAGYWQARFDVMADTTLEGTDQMTKMEHEKASPEQIAAVLAILEKGLSDGAVGIGFPLEYMPAATQAEALEVFRLAAKHNAPAHVHMRSWGYDDKHIRSYGDLYELFGAAITAGTDVHVLHLNSSYNDWTPIGLEMITRAQAAGLPVTTEMYPYAYGGCPSSAAYFDDWETYPDDYFSTKLRIASTGEWLTKEKFREIRESNIEVRVICYDNTEEMVTLALASPLTMIASDGGQLHPRTAGTYSRILGRYVREQGALPLMEALRKMTLMPAQHMQERAPAMRKKGRVQVGADADLVVFDPATILDMSTVIEPLRPSVGMQAVLVAGIPVVSDGVLQDGVYPGRAIRGEQR